MSNENNCYVEKHHYDKLFKQWDRAMRENAQLRHNLNIVREYAKTPAPDIYETMQALEVPLDEQMAYIAGAFRVLSGLELLFRTMEETEDGKVSSDQQQNQV